MDSPSFVKFVMAALPLVLSIVASILSWRASEKAKQAKEQSVETHGLVNSRMSELLALAKSEAAAVAVLAEKEAEEMKKGGKLEDAERKALEILETAAQKARGIGAAVDVLGDKHGTATLKVPEQTLEVVKASKVEK